MAIKPGKPVWFGRVRGKLVMGLPGNPTSAMVTARLLLAPLIAGLSGRDPMSAVQWQSAELAGELGPVGDRETFVRGRWTGAKVEPAPNQDAGSQKTLADSDVLIRRLAGARLNEGHCRDLDSRFSLCSCVFYRFCYIQDAPRGIRPLDGIFRSVVPLAGGACVGAVHPVGDFPDFRAPAVLEKCPWDAVACEF